jgi:penicillin amidase
MKNFFAFLFYALLCLSFIFFLNTYIAPLPPMGKFLNPFGGFWQNAENEKINFPKTLDIDGLQQEVTIQYDNRMVPHIFAENENDLFMAQGYVTAQHRLWQMEIQTRAAAGRLAEITGQKQVEFDRYQRRIGMVHGAKKSLDSMLKNPDTRRIVESYAHGVNAYINSLRESDLPLEYKLLDYKPEEWTSLKSALLLKSMSYNLSGSEKDFEYTNFLNLYGRELTDLLFPDFVETQQPVVDKSNEIIDDKAANKTANSTKQVAKLTKIPEKTKVAVADRPQIGWNFMPLQVENPKEKYTPELYLSNQDFSANPANGSNNWAVSGKKTASGLPILCNDPHLGLSLPSVWYEIQLHCPTFNVYGVSLPGTPTVIIGFNDSIAWGVTNAKRDVMDWYKIKFKDKSRNEYLYNGNWKQSIKKTEKIIVRNQFDVEKVYQPPFSEVTDTIIYTHLGMVSYDQHFDTANRHKQGFALRWTAHDASNELQTFYLLNKAKNYGDFRQALTSYACPAQNFIFASAQNDIAIQIQGKFPVKWQEQGKFILDGADPTHAWQAYIPQEHQVREKNPARNFVSSANQHPVDKTYPYYVFDHHYEYYRNRRINNYLDSATNITVKTMQKLQNDNFNLMAAENLPFLLEQLDKNFLNAEEIKVYDELLRWNYYNEANLIAPVYFEEWIKSIMELTYDEIANAKVPLPKPEKFITLQLLRNQTLMPLWDNQKTLAKENPQLIIRLAFIDAIQNIKTWRKTIMGKENKTPIWANYKQTSVQHLAKIAPFGAFFLQNGGNYNTVNATSAKHGPSWRMIVEFTDKGVKGYGIYPGGQSGNAGSPYYTNLLKEWEQGEYAELKFWKNKKEGEKQAIFVQE